MDQKPALLVDVRNALYRSIYAVKADRRNSIKYHYFAAFLRQATSWMNKFRPESVHIFWDAPRKEVWRRKILPTYKDRATSTYVEDISEDLARTTAVAKDFFDHMNVRQYDKKTMEADDLIYAAVTMMHPRKTIIISSDSDMNQIPFNYSSCSVYDPSKQKMLEITDINPAIQKSLVGDKSDFIPGYHGIGPKKSENMLREPEQLQEFLKSSGPATYYRNMLLIDLSLNPKLLHNKVYVQRQLSKSVNFNAAEISNLINKHKVNGLLQEYADLVLPFQNLT